MPLRKKKGGADDKICEKSLEEYAYVESLVMKYQTQFAPDANERTTEEAKEAANELIIKFQPLIKKYHNLIKTAQVDFYDPEMKRFVLGFIGDPTLKAALKRKYQKSELRHSILTKFNFVKETYGSLPDDEISTDLAMLLLILAKRYKQVGKNFCAYLYNSYCYEVSRHIKKFIKNPANIHYRNIQYEDYMQSNLITTMDMSFEDRMFENSLGIPDHTWVNGETCDEMFVGLTNLERHLLIKYYLEDYNDRQIGDEFGLHINTVNQKRRKAVAKVAEAVGIDLTKIKRNRKSGLQALKRGK